MKIFSYDRKPISKAVLWLQYFSLFLLGANYIVYNAYGFHAVKNIIRILALLLLFASWFLDGRHAPSMIAIAFAAIAVLQWLINGSEAFNILALVEVSIVFHRSEREEAKKFYNVSCVLLGVVLLLLVFGQLSSITQHIGSRYRSTLGFLNPNAAALFYSSALFLYALSKEAIFAKDVKVVFTLFIVLFAFTRCRTELLSSLLFVALITYFWVYKKATKKDVVMRICMIFVDVLFALCIVCAGTIQLWLPLDGFLSGRISIYMDYIERSGLRGLLIGGVSDTVDSFFFTFLFKYGVFVYIAFALATHNAMMVLIRNERFTEISFLTAMFAYGVMESSIFRPEVLAVLCVWKSILDKPLPKTISNCRICKIYSSKMQN